MKEYQKIETVFERDTQTKKLLFGKFRNPTVKYLASNEWNVLSVVIFLLLSMVHLLSWVQISPLYRK